MAAPWRSSHGNRDLSSHGNRGLSSHGNRDISISAPPEVDVFAQRIVRVGFANEEVSVPVCVLTKSSSFFRAAVKDTWNNGTDGAITLPHEDMDSFKPYLQWLYTGDLYVLDPETARKSFQDDGFGERQWAHNRLAAMFVFGTFVSDDRYCNAIVDEVVKYTIVCNELMGRDAVEYAFGNLLPTSKLVEFMRDIVTWSGDIENWSPQGFVEEIAKEAIRKARDGEALRDPRQINRCRYHTHNENAPASGCGGSLRVSRWDIMGN